MRLFIYYFILNGILSLSLSGCYMRPDYGSKVPQKGIYASKKAIVVPTWNDNQIVTAIYYAEGGENARYPYGIRSVRCTGNTECHQVCLTTVKRNRERFTRYGSKNTSNFITFLGTRYCPVGASNDRKNVNKNWIKNVTWYLNHPKKES